MNKNLWPNECTDLDYSPSIWREEQASVWSMTLTLSYFPRCDGKLKYLCLWAKTTMLHHAMSSIFHKFLFYHKQETLQPSLWSTRSVTGPHSYPSWCHAPLLLLPWYFLLTSWNGHFSGCPKNALIWIRTEHKLTQSYFVYIKSQPNFISYFKLCSVTFSTVTSPRLYVIPKWQHQ